MSFQPSIKPTYTQNITFDKESESVGCCCFFKSRPVKKEYIVTDDNKIISVKKANFQERIEANNRLACLIKNQFEKDPIENEKAFEILKMRINNPMENGEPITSEKLRQIVNEIHNLKIEINKERLS